MDEIDRNIIVALQEDGSSGLAAIVKEERGAGWAGSALARQT